MNDHERYLAAAHAVQSGVMHEMNYNEHFTTPKHLRTGIDLSKAEQGGLAELLIAKGIFTKEEYIKAMADAAEAEQKRYEDRLTELIGKPIKLI